MEERKWNAETWITKMSVGLNHIGTCGNDIWNIQNPCTQLNEIYKNWINLFELTLVTNEIGHVFADCSLLWIDDI